MLVPICCMSFCDAALFTLSLFAVLTFNWQENINDTELCYTGQRSVLLSNLTAWSLLLINDICVMVSSSCSRMFVRNRTIGPLLTFRLLLALLFTIVEIGSSVWMFHPSLEASCVVTEKTNLLFKISLAEVSTNFLFFSIFLLFQPRILLEFTAKLALVLALIIVVSVPWFA